MLVVDLRGKGIHRRLVADVGLICRGPGTGFPDSRGGVLRRGEITVDDHHGPGTLAGQLEGGRAPDSGACPGDQRELPRTSRGPVRSALAGAAPSTTRSIHSPASRATTSGRAVTTQWPPSIGTTLLPNGIEPVNRCSAGVTKMSLRGTSTWTGTFCGGQSRAGVTNGAGMLARYRLSPLT